VFPDPKDSQALAFQSRCRSWIPVRVGLQFLGHHSWLFFGIEPWSGQWCQKHPSVKTATLALAKMMSGRDLIASDTRTLSRYLNLSWWSPGLTAGSSLVSHCD
jgi:hypothetical protein